MTDTVRLHVGFDQREAAAYHVFCQSVIERATVPVAFNPLTTRVQSDGSNAFTLSRFLVPALCNYTGWAIFADGDMVCETDIAELWELRAAFAFNTACAVVKHDYKTKSDRKYIGTPMESYNEDYPRKNWSSLVLWNCGHYANRQLTKDFILEKGGKFLHRFEWLKDEQIGSLPPEWNHLVGESTSIKSKIRHYTLGIPGIRHYAFSAEAIPWHNSLYSLLECPGEHPLPMVERAL